MALFAAFSRSRGLSRHFSSSSSMLGRWMREANQFMDQALAGPGRVARTEETIFDFSREDGSGLRGWNVSTDGGIGGSSGADVRTLAEGGVSFARFSGHLCPPFPLPTVPVSTRTTRKGEEIASDDAKEEGEGEEAETRLGTAFAVLQTEKGLLRNLDLEPFQALVLRVRGDGRKYIVSLRTENWIVPGSVSDDVYQGYIQPEADSWEEVELPFAKFLLTHRGKVVNDQTVMNHRNLFSMSFASVGFDEIKEDNQPFSLDVQWIKATLTDEGV